MEENVTPPPPPAYPTSAAPPPAPPYLTPPPPLIAPTGPVAPRSRGRGWMVLAIILLLLFGISALFNMGHFMSGLSRGRGVKYSRAVGPKLEEVIVEDNDGMNKIALVEVNGIITSRSMDQGGYNIVELIKAQLKRAEDDFRVKAVILRVDSPGGEVLASDEIYREIADFQKRPTHKPVIASMGNLAASGGYYVSAPCQWIVANDLTITGSIGVIMHSYNYRHLMDKVGLQPQTFKSGKYKDMLSGDRVPEEIPAEEKQMVQNLIDETYGKFKSVVADGRKQAHDKNKAHSEKGRELAEDWTNYADGRVLSGTEAYKLGFVDELGNFQDAVKRAKALVNISGPVNLIQYQQHYDLADIFRIFGRSEAKTIKVDLGLDPPRLQAGQLYFLSPTFIH
jgi:protease-4